MTLKIYFTEKYVNSNAVKIFYNFYLLLANKKILFIYTIQYSLGKRFLYFKNKVCIVFSFHNIFFNMILCSEINERKPLIIYYFRLVFITNQGILPAKK